VGWARRGTTLRFPGVVGSCTQARVPHDREVDIAGKWQRQADVLLKAWYGRRDLAVDLTTVHPNPATSQPLRGSATTFRNDKGEQKFRESADSWGRMCILLLTLLILPMRKF